MKYLKRILVLLLIIISFLIGYYVFNIYIDNNKFDKNIDNKLNEDNTLEEKLPKEERFSLIMVGDTLIHNAIYGDAYKNGVYDFNYIFTEVKDTISSYDLAFYNQESILGGSEIGLSTYPRFNSPYEVGDALLNIGFNIVSLANNHTLDRGEQAIINSRNYWNQKDVLVSGSNTSFEEQDEIIVKEKNGITYTMLSYTDLTNGLKAPKGKEYLVNLYNKERLKNDIEKVRNKVDLLMVSIHYGEEYVHEPTYKELEIVDYLKSLGVDIIIGHHPHVVQRMEFDNNQLTIYSLGNFLSAQRGIERLTGLMAGIDVVKKYDGDSYEIILEKPTAELVYTYSKYASNGGRYDFKLYPYKKLNNDILNNYEMYYNKYMNIVTNGSELIEKR